MIQFITIRNIIAITMLLFTFNACGQSQAEMNTEKLTEYEKADKKLNDVYNRILLEYASDEVFIDKLKKSQRIWIQFRDSELEMRYPETEKRIYYGSMYPMCESAYLTELTVKRIKTLEQWLQPFPEGEGCRGSIKDL